VATRKLIVRRLGANPPDTLVVVHQLRFHPMRAQASLPSRFRALATVAGAWTQWQCRPSECGFGGSAFKQSGARPGFRASVPSPLFRPVIVWGNLAPNSSFKPTLLRNAA
jgi:hypothetical protein